MKNLIKDESISLYKWIWKSYIRTALIPLLIVELIFICIYFGSNIWSHKKTVIFFKGQVQDQLEQIANQEASGIDDQLSSITNSTMFFSIQMGRALSTQASLTPIDYDRLTYSKEGAYYTKKDSEDGGASIFYSGIVPIKEDEQEKVARALTQQNLMADIKNTQPLAASIYLNTFDSFNMIYPYFDVISKYPPLSDIPSNNFYYEADAAHNPERKVKWTDVYLDQSGDGLITSALCPVYNDGFLEGVVGINMTINTIANQILTMHIPWHGYALLIGKNGNILVLPNSNKTDWNLDKINDNIYDGNTLKDNFNSDQFNLYKNKDLNFLTNKITNDTSGFSNFMLKNQSRVLSWSTISNTGWKLLLVVPEQDIYSKVDILIDNIIKIGIFMTSGLILSYIIIFLVISKKTKKISSAFSNSLLKINSLVQRISDGNYNQEEPTFKIEELKNISVQLIQMGKRLGKTNKNLLITQYELEKKETDLKALVNSINDIILEVDSKGYITNFWSKSHHDLYELYMRGNFSSIDDILDKDTCNRAREKILYVLQTKETVTIEFSIESNSDLKWFEACISSRLNYETKVVVSARDITEQKKLASSIISAKEEAEKANKAKSEFLSSMSHELRTPLNAILGFSQVLELDPESPLTYSQQQSVEEILKAGNHLLELINEVLDLSKIESGKVSISIECVEIKPVMEETFAIIKPFADKHNIKIITYPIEDSNEFVSSDRTRLKQILLNLLSNAIKYNKQNGQVIFYHDRIDDKYRFHVIDTGIGISDFDLDFIFKPFHRLNELNNSIEGTGIGLTVSKQLVELMSGEIYVESQKDIGSHFCVEFPSTDLCILQANEDVILDENPNYFFENRLYKVLYVEDNPANLRLVERILKQINNIEIFSATSGELCIDLAVSHKPDLILLDINLPGMDGHEVFKRLQMHEETHNIPIVAISAHAMPQDIEKAFSLGFADYITKPINVVSFSEKISNILVNNELKDTD